MNTSLLSTIDDAVDALWHQLLSQPAVAQAVAESHARWHAARDDAALQVTVFGVYDAGKSSLIKRLLVELGAPVPDWLTISARPETYAATRVEAGT